MWRCLDRISKDPHQEELSQRMKCANACRVNLGRTGPRGEEGIWEDMYQTLGRESYPDELEYEMRRNKGYDGVSTRRKEARLRLGEASPEAVSGGSLKEVRAEEIEHMNPVVVLKKRGNVQDNGLPSPLDLNSIRRMEKQLEQLQEALKIARGNVVTDFVQNTCPSSYVPTAGEGSNGIGDAVLSTLVSGREGVP